MNKKLIIIIAVVLVIVIIGGVAAFFLLRPKDDKPKEIVYSEFPLGEMYMNIKTPEDAPRKTVLKCNIVIEYTDEEVLPILEKKKTTMITEVRKYFINRTSEQLSNLDRVQEDLTDLAIEITETDSTKITNILLLDFILQ